MISKLEHPLEMLSTEEISLAYEIYKTSEDYDEATHFSQISLVEPTKELLKDFKPGDPFEREVKLIGRDSVLDGGFVATINLSNKTLSRKSVKFSTSSIYRARYFYSHDSSERTSRLSGCYAKKRHYRYGKGANRSLAGWRYCSRKN